MSIYLINIHTIEKWTGTININGKNYDSNKNSKNNKISINSKPLDVYRANQDSDLKLVEFIEESGFIPSIDKNKDINAA